MDIRFERLLKRVTALLILFSVFFIGGGAHAVNVVGKEYPTIAGAQIFVLPEEYTENLDVYFTEVKDKGVDTVFFRVFHNNGDRVHLGVDNYCKDGGVYFKTNGACVVSALLDDVIVAAHRQNIKVFAWMATRSLTFLKSNPSYMSQSYAKNGGEISTIKGYGANLFHPDVQRSIRNLFYDLAQSNIDGILLQDDFIYKYSEGVDRLACDQFKLDTGLGCDVETLFPNTAPNLYSMRGDNYVRWAEWKSNYLANLLKNIRFDLRVINPEIKWAVNIYYETPVYPDKGLHWYSQSLENIWATGVDYIAVMAYQEQIQSEMKLTAYETDIYMMNLAKGALSSIPMSEITQSNKTWNNMSSDLRSEGSLYSSSKVGLNSRADGKVRDRGRAIFKIQVKRFDKYGTMYNPMEVYKLMDVLSRAGGKSYVQLPITHSSNLVPYVTD